jgi:hypothetical protein
VSHATHRTAPAPTRPAADHQLTSFQISGSRVASSAGRCHLPGGGRFRCAMASSAWPGGAGWGSARLFSSTASGGGRRSCCTARGPSRSAPGGGSSPASRLTSARLLSAAASASGSVSSGANSRLRRSCSTAGYGSPWLRASTPSVLCAWAGSAPPRRPDLRPTAGAERRAPRSGRPAARATARPRLVGGAGAAARGRSAHRRAPGAFGARSRRRAPAPQPHGAGRARQLVEGGRGLVVAWPRWNGATRTTSAAT